MMPTEPQPPAEPEAISGPDTGPPARVSLVSEDVGGAVHHLLPGGGDLPADLPVDSLVGRQLFLRAACRAWHQYWDNMYVRGAISGLGVVNLYISLIEVLRLRRFAKH